MNDLDSLSINISNTLKNKFPDIDNHHYSPNIIKNFINKSKVNYKSKDGIQTVLNSLTNTFTKFRTKTNKERQTYGIVDFDFNNVTKTPPTAQQKLVQREPIEKPIYDSSRREFLNPAPLIIDSGMVNNQYNQSQNQSQNKNNKNNKNNVYLNQIETNNNYQGNYHSTPAPINTTFNLNELNNLPIKQNFNGISKDNKSDSTDINVNNNDTANEINHTDRYILMDKQRDLLKEETSEWTHYLVIDSKDRDFKAFPDPNYYTIRFSPPGFNSENVRAGFVDKLFNNVKSIELIRCGFLDTSSEEDSSDTGGIDPSYIILEVEEFGTQHNGTNQHLNKSLAILDTHFKQGKFKYYDVMYDDAGTVNRFNPRTTIDKMTFRFKLPDGSLYNFGSNNKSKTTTINYMVFKITVLQKTIESSFLNKTYS
jgi:hypothetical protein